VFEDKELADRAVIAVEKAVHHEDMEPFTSKNGSGTEIVENKALDRLA
jgi:hypothetical protein